MSEPTTNPPPAAASDLWRRLDAFKLDDPAASLTFTRRLARENGWSHAFASRVVSEYKRFVYLAMTAGHEVTPSDEVDQAWHLHLTYTRSYWGELCGDVLGRPLHHGPTKGGSAEGERFEDQYERTLASYRAAFADEPPGDVWPPSDIRFGEAASFVRVNRREHFILGKPRWAHRRPTLVMGLAGVGVLGAMPIAAQAVDELVVPIIVLIVLSAFIGIVAASAKKSQTPQNKKSGPNGLGDSGAANSPWWVIGDGGDSGGDGGGDGGGGDGGSGGGASGCGGGGCGGGGCGAG